MENPENPWKIVKKATIHDNPWISVTRHDVINPGGKPGLYTTVHFKNLAIGIIPLDEEGNTWIVGQHRFPLNAYTWEIPEGGGKLDVPPLESAKRELLEETGIKAGKWEKILEMELSNSVSDEQAIIYLARDLSFHPPRPDENEQLEIRKIPFEDLYQMVLENKVKDSLTVAGVLKVKLMLDC